MLEQLRSAGESLRASIDNYLSICSILHDSLSQCLPRELATYLEQEFTLISPYEQKMQQACIAIGQARNCCTGMTPIGKLPSEILTRIFQLVSENPCRLCSPNDPGFNPSHSRYPDRLVQVCSRWRKTAFSSPTPWTHIDLSPDPRFGRGIWERTRAYIERTGAIPCEIHVDDKRCESDFPYRVEEVISSLAPRSKALEFTITSPEFLPFYSDVLQRLLSKCNPEIFKTFRLLSLHSFPDRFIHGHDHASCREDIDSSDTGAYNRLNLSDSELDKSLAGVTIIHLRGVFFECSSQLYHGLVDLRLTGQWGDVPRIYESELVPILSCSPGLKILHFSLDLFPEDPEGKSTNNRVFDPVPLKDLEEIHISTTIVRAYSHLNFHLGLLLRLLAPGSKSLRLRLETTNNRNEPLFCSGDTRQFFARTKVEKRWIKQGAPSMTELLLCHLPHLKFLVFGTCQVDSFEATLGSCTWVVHDADLYQSDLCCIVKSCPTRLVISSVLVLDGDMNLVSGELRAILPTVQFLDVSSHIGSMPDWDMLDRYVFSSNLLY